MPKKRDLPAMPFYVGDWLKCPEVRALPPDYRGLWFDLICYMWESTERGVMVNPSGNPYTEDEIIRMVGLDNQNSTKWLTKLLENGVCYKRKSDGAIFSKRMVKDEKLREIRRISGSKGGNPNLLSKEMDKYMVNQKVKQMSEDEDENEDEDVIKDKDSLINKEEKKENNTPPSSKKDLAIKLTCEYYRVNEINHFQYFALISNCLELINKLGRIDEYISQLKAYREYKLLTKQEWHSYVKFLGSPEGNCEDGIWASQDWTLKLKDYKELHTDPKDEKHVPQIRVKDVLDKNK